MEHWQKQRSSNMSKKEISYSDWRKEIDILYKERQDKKKSNLTNEQIEFLKYCLDKNKKPKIPYIKIAEIYNKRFGKNYAPDSFASMCCHWKNKGII